MRFDLTDLRLFLHTAEAGSITAGAERSHLTLASASARIRGMEETLGAPLLMRNRRGVETTAAGRTLAHHARVVLQQMDRMRGELGEYARGLKGYVRLLSNTAAMTEFLPETLSAFLAAHPEVDIDLEELVSHEIVEAIAQGRADIGIVNDAVDLSGLETFPFRHDRLVLVTARDHPLAERSARVANHLRALGVQRGDRILLILGNVPALWDVMLASIKLGAVIIPATTLLTAEDLRERIAMGDVRHVIVGGADCAKLDVVSGTFTRIATGTDKAPAGWHHFEDAYGASPEFTPDAPTLASDPLLLYFTSGTTSKPKLVMHTHASYPVGHLSTLYWIGLRPGDVHWNISSPGWAKHAWSCFFAPWNAGATVFVYNYARFDSKAALDVLCRAKVTTLCAPPTVWRMLIQEDLAAWKPALRELVGAGEPLNPEVIERVRAAWGITIRDGYGQTETTCQVGNSPGQPVKPGSMGRPLPGYQITLRDPDGNEASEGEICIELKSRPLALMEGYAGNAEKTAEAMRGGVYHTSDIAARDASGYLTYVGRADDVFKASDYRVSPFELESVLIEHPAIAEAAVVPSPDPVRLAVPKAFLVLRAGHEPGRELARDILRFCQSRLASYKRVRRIEFAELPKTISGKIRRVELRLREAARPETGRNPQEYWEDDFPAD